MRHIETDPHSGAEVYQLLDDPRPADNIYGEQPYASPDGRRVAVRFYPAEGRDGALGVLDLDSGEVHTLIDAMPRFPAFCAWGPHLYGQQNVDGQIVLRRWDWGTLACEDVLTLPSEATRPSYGTMSPDGRQYAVSITREDQSRAVLHAEVARGQWTTLADSRTHRPGGEGRHYLFKHEQFSRDGTHRVLIQANVLPEVHEVHLGVLAAGQEGVRRLACDRPHTPRPTGHEAWIGATDGVLFSTDYDGQRQTNLFTVDVGDAEPRPVIQGPTGFCHVSASRCGRFWVADAPGEPGIPIYAGRIGTGLARPLVVSRTVHDGQQWSHTHPYLTADNRWLVYTSTLPGRPTVHAARVPDAFWES